MPTPLRFSALQMPLRGGWMLELRRRGVTGECGVCAALPAGWLGSEEDSGPLAWRRVARGPAVTLAETAPLVWEI